MSASLHTHREGIYQILRTRFELINASIGHNLTQGEENESVIRDLLVSTLPQKYGIGSGIIVGTDGIASKQIDIIIYDRESTNLTLGEKSRIFFADQVLMAIEIKTTFTTGSGSSLESTVNNLSTVKKLNVCNKEWIESVVNNSDGSNGFKRFTPAQPITVGFFFTAPDTSGPINLKNFFDSLKNQINSVPFKEQPDVLFSLNHASFFRHSDIGLHTQESQEFLSFLVQSSSNSSQVLIVDDKFKNTKLLVDFDEAKLSAAEIPGGFFGANKGSSNLYLKSPENISESPNIYRVASARAGEFVFIDRVRGFLAFIEMIALLLRMKKINPLWNSTDYFGPSFTMGSKYPQDFLNFGGTKS